MMEYARRGILQALLACVLSVSAGVIACLSLNLREVGLRPAFLAALRAGVDRERIP